MNATRLPVHICRRALPDRHRYLATRTARCALCEHPVWLDPQLCVDILAEHGARDVHVCHECADIVDLRAIVDPRTADRAREWRAAHPDIEVVP